MTDDDGKHRSLVDQYANVQLPPPAIGPAATPIGIGAVGSAAAVPAARPETFVCLRGPCRFYWELETFMASGNPQTTWDPEIGLKDEHGKPIRMPRQVNRTCLVHPGTETELTEDVVYNCSRWDPMSPREVRAREKRIAKYFRNYPHHRDPKP